MTDAEIYDLADEAGGVYLADYDCLHRVNSFADAEKEFEEFDGKLNNLVRELDNIVNALRLNGNKLASLLTEFECLG